MTRTHLGHELKTFPSLYSGCFDKEAGVSSARATAAAINLFLRASCASLNGETNHCPQLSQKLESGRSFLPHFLQKLYSFTLPVYADYADAKWNLMPNSYPELGFRGIIGMHIYNKKDGPCKCANTHTTLTQTLSGQRRAELDSIRPTACSVGLFCCLENGGDI